MFQQCKNILGITLVVLLLHPSLCISSSTAAAAKTLVLYVYSGNDPEYAANLEFMVQYGMREDDGNDYYIIIQEVSCETPSQADCVHSWPQWDPRRSQVMVQDEGTDSSNIALPDLPANGRYVYHANECFDWGTVGWALSTLKLNLDIYTFFIFMNSSVRGPFLPAYWPVSTCILKSSSTTKYAAAQVLTDVCTCPWPSAQGALEQDPDI